MSNRFLEYDNNNSDLENIRLSHPFYINSLNKQEELYIEFLNNKERTYDIILNWNWELILSKWEKTININKIIEESIDQLWDNGYNFLFSFANSQKEPQWYFTKKMDKWSNEKLNVKVEFPEAWVYERWFLLSIYFQIQKILKWAMRGNGKSNQENAQISWNAAINFDKEIYSKFGSEFAAVSDFKNREELQEYIGENINISENQNKYWNYINAT